MVLGILPVPGRLTNMDKAKAKANCVCSRCWYRGGGAFFSRLSFLFSISLSLGNGPIKTKILSQRAENNHPTKMCFPS